MLEMYAGENALLYDSYLKGKAGDVEFFVQEALKSGGGPVLEIGCGTGRILLPIKEAGVDIMGLDNSRDMLGMLRAKKRGDTVELIEGDMRNFSIDKKFSLIIIPYNAFLYNISLDDQVQTLRNIKKHLLPKGRLIFSIFNPPMDTVNDGILHFQGEIIHPLTHNKVIVWYIGNYNVDKQLLNAYFIFKELENGRVIKELYCPFNLSYIYKYEMFHLLSLCNYKVLNYYGDFYKSPTGREQVWIVTPTQ